MSPQQTQDPNNQGMTADQAAASLAFATHLQDQMIPKQAPQTPESAPTEAKPQETTNEPVDTESLKKELKKDVEEAVNKAMAGLKEEISKALSDENE